MTKARVLPTLLLLLITVAASSCAADTAETAASGQATSSSVSAGTLPPNTVHLVSNSAGPPLALGSPLCDPSGRCVYSFTESATVHGDREGTTYGAGGAAPDETLQHFSISKTELFVGTVKGCGTGSYVSYITENATATEGSGEGDIVVGSGTGDLANISGHGSGEGTVSPDGITSTFESDLTCGH